ncbi:MAG: ABC transporter permease [Chitinophagales bacterium]|nr:ABC transporter permease [Chitinophagales bacterium]
MFNLDIWQEIFQTLSKNKLRTFLTAFSVAWGIFMLMLLLGFGNGLQNGAKSAFASDAVNSIWFDAHETSVAYKGLGEGRKIHFENTDWEYLNGKVEGVQLAASRNMIWQASIKYGERSTNFDILWVHPNYKHLESLKVTKGRFLNANDYRTAAKVVALGKIAEGLLFSPGEDPIGKYIIANGVPFKVVGIFEDPGGDRDMRRLYMPMTTGQKVYNGKDHVQNLSMLVGNISIAESKALEKKVVKELSDRHLISQEDKRAISVWNNVEEYSKVMGIFTVINLVVWWVGLMTLLAGVIGVGNIMMITVKDRTREIGIRKAMGATPASIMGLIMQEAIFITIVSGYIGMLAGIWLLESGAIMNLLTSLGTGTDFFKNPSVDFGTAISATVVLIVAGSLAGYIPARRAANINPIAAIRDE